MQTTDAGTTLPRDLAPALRERVVALLAEVPLAAARTTERPPPVIDLTYRGPRCVVCHEGGKLGGHHGADGRVEWIHKSCHRQLHARHRLTRAEMQRISRRGRRTAC